MMTLSLSQFDGYAGYLSALVTEGAPPAASYMRGFYRLLATYYGNNGLYDYIQEQLEATRLSTQDLKPLRNPAHRVVEFYSAKLWPGRLPDALPIVADNERIIPAVERLWQWSNWSSRKQRMARWFAVYGDCFLKINTRRTPAGEPVSVYMHLVKPEYVTALELDERGFLTYIRMDVPDGDEMHTEVWDKATQEARVWRHDQGWDIELERINREPTVAAFADLTGENFIPIVYQPFKDDGEGRGGGAFTHVLDKIDEANRQATRLAQMLFRHNRALWALSANMVDSSGRPMPAPSLSGALNSDSEFDLEDNDIVSLPGMSTLQSLVPQLNYTDALTILQDQMQDIQHDLPELAYYDIREMTELSGRAVRLMLDDAISRLQEARGNGETALMRAHEMALTIGSNLELPGFADLGDYEAGDFAHSFKDRPVLPMDKLEQAQIAATLAGTFNARQSAIEAGFTEEAADEMTQVEIPGGEPR